MYKRQTGTQGFVGTQGTTGSQGTAGFVGSNGAQGATGSQGTTGTTGLQGSIGAQGANGSNGAQGTTGLQGFTGSQGTIGSQGTQPAVSYSQWRKAASGGETTLSGTDDFSTTLAYTVGAESVYVNGVLLERGVDYTATNGTSVSLTSALVAGDISTVASPSSFSVANAIPLSQFTAKGDILVGTGASTETALNVGADGTTLVANSSSATGVAWAGPIYTAGKNFIINGGFDIWQRGTSFASVSGYFADRWTNSSTVSGITSSQQSSGAPIGSQYYVRHTSTSSGSYISTYSYLESATIAPLLGQTVTFTLKLRRNSTMSANINVRLSKSSTTDAGSGATWTDISVNTVANASMPTGTGSSNWYTSTITASIPNDGTANSLRISTDFSATVSSGSTLDIAQAQLEIGSTATAFSRAGGTLQGELAACQRYYYRVTATGSTNNALPFMGTNVSTTSAFVQIPLPVVMRSAPSSLDYSNLGFYIFRTGYNGAITSVTLNINYSQNQVVTFNGSGYTINDSGIVNQSSTSSYIGFSAEL